MIPKWELWRTVRGAAEASFPDRAPALLAGLERRLEPGPWTVEVPALAPPWTRDRLIADIARAVHANDAVSAEAQLGALERWLHDAAVVELNVVVGLRELGLAWDESFVDWAARALEAGLDTPTLRILAGLEIRDHAEVEDRVRRTMRELAVAPLSQGQRAMPIAMHFARETLQGRMDESTLARRLREVFATFDPMSDQATLWRSLDYGQERYYEQVLEQGPSSWSKDVREAARALIGAPPEAE